MPPLGNCDIPAGWSILNGRKTGFVVSYTEIVRVRWLCLILPKDLDLFCCENVEYSRGWRLANYASMSKLHIGTISYVIIF